MNDTLLYSTRFPREGYIALRAPHLVTPLCFENGRHTIRTVLARLLHLIYALYRILVTFMIVRFNFPTVGTCVDSTQTTDMLC